MFSMPRAGVLCAPHHHCHKSTKSCFRSSLCKKHKKDHKDHPEQPKQEIIRNKNAKIPLNSMGSDFSGIRNALTQTFVKISTSKFVHILMVKCSFTQMPIFGNFKRKRTISFDPSRFIDPTSKTICDSAVAITFEGSIRQF